MIEAESTNPQLALLFGRFQTQVGSVDRAPALPLEGLTKPPAQKLRAMVPAKADDYLAFMKSAEDRYPDYFAQMDANGGISTWSLSQIEAFAAAAPHPFLAGWVWGRLVEMMSAGQFTRQP